MERMMIHEIPGFSFGQVQDLAAGTGCTVILCPEGGVTGVDVRGGSPGTRDTDALNPVCNMLWSSPAAAPLVWMLPEV